MFLVGGPAYSGTALLALLLNQGKVVCLNEPDFHNPVQSHRAIPYLQKLFPDRAFPERPDRELSYSHAVDLIQSCENVIEPFRLGVKTCNFVFMDYAYVYKRRKYPVIGLIRDIRDALVSPLPDWITEESLNRAYRLIWENRNTFDIWFRYEDLVQNPKKTISEISKVLSYPFEVLQNWDPKTVHVMLYKSERDELIRHGGLSVNTIGRWKSARKVYKPETYRTAKMMGYSE